MDLYMKKILNFIVRLASIGFAIALVLIFLGLGISLFVTLLQIALLFILGGIIFSLLRAGKRALTKDKNQEDLSKQASSAKQIDIE